MLDDTVAGILKFMHRKGIISIAAREADSSPAIRPSSLTFTDAPTTAAAF